MRPEKACGWNLGGVGKVAGFEVHYPCGDLQKEKRENQVRQGMTKCSYSVLGVGGGGSQSCWLNWGNMTPWLSQSFYVRNHWETGKQGKRWVKGW